MTTVAEIDRLDGVDTRWFQDRLADKRLSQRKLATHLHLDPAAVSLMIRGKRKMSAAEAAEIARLLNVSVDEVLARAGCSATVPTKASRRAAVAAREVSAMSEERPEEMTPPAAGAGAGNGVGGMFDLPVPLADGSVAVLRLPHRLGSADADRIAALVRAFAV